MRALPYIVLGIFTCLSLILYLSGCALSHNWYPLFVLFPALLACFFVYAFTKTNDDSYQPGCFSFTADSSIFLLICSIILAIGLPATFYRCKILDLFSLLMHFGGDLLTAIGIIVFSFMQRKTEYSLF